MFRTVPRIVPYSYEFINKAKCIALLAAWSKTWLLALGKIFPYYNVRQEMEPSNENVVNVLGSNFFSHVFVVYNLPIWFLKCKNFMICKKFEIYETSPLLEINSLGMIKLLIFVNVLCIPKWLDELSIVCVLQMPNICLL